MPGRAPDEAHQIGVDLAKSPELTSGGWYERGVSRLSALFPDVESVYVPETAKEDGTFLRRYLRYLPSNSLRSPRGKP